MAIEGLTPSEQAQFDAMGAGDAPAPDAPATPPAAPPAEPPAEPPAAPPPAPPPAEPPADKRMVPHSALHEERERAKEERNKRMELERQLNELKPPEQEPDENADPIGTIAWLKAERAREKREREEAAAQQAYIADLGQRIATRIDAYAKDHPEYQDQVRWLREFRFRELTEGLGYAPPKAAKQIQMEELQLGAMAVDQDMDPGAMVAKLAEVRGWKPATPAPVPPPVTPAPAPAEQAIDRRMRGQRAGISPSAAGGGGPEPEMSLETLLSLDGAAFSAAFKKHGKKLMGG